MEPEQDEFEVDARSETRMYPLRYHEVQHEYWISDARFNIVPAGRRSGKTEIAKRKIVKRAFAHPREGGSKFSDPRYFCAAPTRDQAKRIFWDDLKRMVPPHLRAKKPSETSLTIYTITGAEIHVLGMDKPERIEGSPWDGGVLDEYGNMKKETWPEHVRPALSDRMGWCDMIGVPEGRNHYYKEYRRALADTSGVRAPFHWISADILPPEEIEEARATLDELTFQQEYEASFINFSGRVYWPYDEKYHGSHPLKQAYSERHPLQFMFDFNVEPGVAAVGQTMRLPVHYGREIGTALIGEVFIPRGSNTVLVCNKLIKDWGKHRGAIFCYGDATGGAKGSAKLLGSDWQIIKDILWSHFGRDKVHFKVELSNPRERDRVNAVNSRLRSTDGKIRMMVDPKHCPRIIDDFDGVVCVEGGSGEIDKTSDITLTHLSDAIGYYCAKEFPVKKRYEQIQEKYWK